MVHCAVSKGCSPHQQVPGLFGEGQNSSLAPCHSLLFFFKVAKSNSPVLLVILLTREIRGDPSQELPPTCGIPCLLLRPASSLTPF